MMRRFLTPLLAIFLALAAVLVSLALGNPDVRADTVQTTIPVGVEPVGPIGVNATTKLAYVANHTGTVSVIDIDSTHPATYNQVIATIPVGALPDGVGVDPLTSRIFVANDADKTVSVIDGNTNTVIATVNVVRPPNAPAVNTRTHLVYVPNYDADSCYVSILDESTNTVVSTFSVGGTFDTCVAAVDTATNRVYVTNSSSKLISAFNGATGKKVKDIAVGRYPVAMAIDKSTSLLYVGNETSDDLSVIDVNPANTATYETVVHTITGIAAPVGLGVNPTTQKIYVAEGTATGHVRVLPGDPASPQYGAVIAKVTVGRYPSGVGVLTGSPGTIYVSNDADNTVSVIEGSNQGDIPTPTVTPTRTATPVVHRAYLPFVP